MRAVEEDGPRTARSDPETSGMYPRSGDGWLDFSAPGTRAIVHAALTAALADIDAACRHLGITYWLHAGSLLGAVRHGGPIPWDDDADLVMPPDDLQAFIAHAPALLGLKYSIETPAEDPFIVPDAKVYLAGTHTFSKDAELRRILPTANDGLFVDIFVMAPVSGCRLTRRLEGQLAQLVHVRPWAARLGRYSSTSLSYRLKLKAASHLPRACTSVIVYWLNKRSRRHPNEFFSTGRFGRNWQRVYHRDTIFPLGSRSFGTLMLPTPRDSDSYLCTLFGSDFHIPPPPGRRGGHISALKMEGRSDIA